MIAGFSRSARSSAPRRVAGVEETTIGDGTGFPRDIVSSCADGVVEVEGEESASSGGTTRTASRRNTLAPRSSSSPRAAASWTRACATCASSLRTCASRTLSGIVSRMPVRRSGGREDCKRVKSVCALSDDCASSGRCCCCGSERVAVDAEVDEDAEPSPSVVEISIKSRDDEAVDGCPSVSEAGVGEAVERLVEICWLRPLCACET
jgi:hypothetical protein